MASAGAFPAPQHDDLVRLQPPARQVPPLRTCSGGTSAGDMDTTMHSCPSLGTVWIITKNLSQASSN